MWFYWIDILSSIKFWIGSILFLFSIPYAFLSVKMIAEYFERTTSYYEMLEEVEKEYMSFFKISKKIFIGMIVIFSLTIAIPKEETFYKMMVAKYATGNNIDVVLEKITEGVDYIFDKIEESEK